MRDKTGPKKPAPKATGAQLVGAAVAAAMPAAKKQRAREIQRVVNRYAENPRANARRLRQLGMSQSFIRAIHKSSVPDKRTEPVPGAIHHGFRSSGFTGSALLDNLLADTAHAAKGFVPSLYQAGRAGYHDVGAGVHGHRPTHLYREVAKPIGQSYAHTYGPAVHGHIGETLHRVHEHPLGPVLDVAALVTGGEAGATKLGLLKKVPTERGLALERGGEPVVQPHASPNQLRRRAQHAYDRYSERFSDLPGVGASSRVTRRLPFERERAHERRLVKGIAHKAALDKLGNKPGEHVAYSVMLDYGSKAAERLDQEIAMRRARIRSHPREAADQARNIIQLRLARKHVENPSARLQAAVNTGRSLSLHTQGEKVRLGFITPEAAAQRVELHSRLATGGRVEKVPGASPKIAAARERVGRIDRLFERALGAAGKREKQLRPRTRTEAEAFIAATDAAYEKVIATMASVEVKPAGLVAKRNARNAKLARRGRPIKETFTAEARRHAENQLGKILRESDHPTAVRLRERLAEADRLRDQLARGVDTLLEEKHPGRRDYGKVPRGRQTKRPIVERLGGAASVAKDELQRLEASYEKRHGVRPGDKETVRLVGGEPPGSGAAYVPDIAPRKAGPAVAHRARSVVGRPRKPDYAKRTEGRLFTSGRARKGAKLTYEDFKRTVRDVARVEDAKAAEALSKPLSEHPAHPGGLEPGHVYYNPAGVRIPPAAREAAARDEVLSLSPREVAEGGADLHRALMENVFPSRESFAAMRPSTRAKLRQIREEHAAAFGAEQASTRFTRARGIAGLLGEVFDTANNVTKGALLYLKGSYVPANHVGNDLFGILKQGPFYFKNLAAVSERFGKRTPEILHRYDIETGTTASQSLAGERGLLQGKVRALAEFSSRHADRGPRRAAMEYELGRRGYKTNAQIEGLFGKADSGDAKATAVLNQVAESAEKGMVQFRGLSKAQRDLVSRAIFVWPWVRGATKWAGNYALDHPLRADLVAHLGEEGHDWVWSKLGRLVSYVDGLIPLGKAEQKLGTTVVPVSNPVSVTPLGTASDAAQVAAGLFGGHPSSRTFTVGGMANPLITAGVEGAFRVDTTTGYPYPADMPWWKIISRNTVEQFPVVRAAQTALAKPPKPFTGSAAKQRLYVPEHGLLDALKVLGLGPARKRYLNLPASEAKARAEQRSFMSPRERLTDDYRTFRVHLADTLKQFGYGEVPKALEGRLLLRYDRAKSRAALGRNPTSLDKYRSDVQFILRHGWVDDAEARQALRWARSASKQDLKTGLRHLTTYYFDSDAMLSKSVGWLNARAGYDSAIDTLARAGKISRAQAADFKKRAASTADADVYRENTAGIRAKYRNIRFPDLPQLTLPEMP